MSSSEKLSKVKVCCRFRPINDLERRHDQGGVNVIEVKRNYLFKLFQKFLNNCMFSL